MKGNNGYSTYLSIKNDMNDFVIIEATKYAGIKRITLIIFMRLLILISLIISFFTGRYSTID